VVAIVEGVRDRGGALAARGGAGEPARLAVGPQIAAGRVALDRALAPTAALELVRSDPERRFLERRLAEPS
jgi:hypothetical protein